MPYSGMGGGACRRPQSNPCLLSELATQLASCVASITDGGASFWNHSW
jgi:hypothetical protein